MSFSTTAEASVRKSRPFLGQDHIETSVVNLTSLTDNKPCFSFHLDHQARGCTSTETEELSQFTDSQFLIFLVLGEVTNGVTIEIGSCLCKVAFQFLLKFPICGRMAIIKY